MAIKPKKSQVSETTEQWPYGKKNYIVFAAAIFVIIVGFILLGQGDDTFSVILLVVGYCVLIPAALILKDDSIEKAEPSEEAEA